MTTTTRDEWIAAGALEFQEHGYNATGIAAVAGRAGALKGSFYNYFASKEAFALEVIAGYARDAKMELLTEDGPATERIRRHFAWLHSELKRRGDLFGCLLGNFAAEASSDNPGIRAAVDQCFRGWTEALAVAIEDAYREAGGDRSVDARAAAQLLIDAWEGALLRAKATADTGPVDAFMSYALDQVLPH